MNTIEIVLLVLSSILLLIIILLFIICFIIHGIIFGRSLVDNNKVKESIVNLQLDKYKDEIMNGINWFKKVNKEEVFIKSNDSLNLKGYLIESNNNSDILVIMAHGYKSCPYFDFSVGGQGYYNKGYNLLFIEQRANESSEGKYTTFGIKEQDDLILWIDYINKRFNNKFQILLTGVSMGSTTVMLTLGKSLASNVKGAICDCGFTSPLEEIQHTIKHNYHMPSHLLSYMLSFVNFLKTGKFLGSVNTIKALSKSTTPVLLVHGDIDEVVPVEMAYKNYENAKCPKDILIVHNANHAASYLVDTVSYHKKIFEFIDKYFNN